MDTIVSALAVLEIVELILLLFLIKLVFEARVNKRVVDILTEKLRSSEVSLKVNEKT